MDPVIATALKNTAPTVVVKSFKYLSSKLFNKNIENILINKTDFEFIIDQKILLEDFPEIKVEPFVQFLKSDDVELIVQQIYNPDFTRLNIEEIRTEFCLSFLRHFKIEGGNYKSFASNLFDILIEGCKITLDKAISQGLISALDAKTQFRLSLIEDKIGKIDDNVQDIHKTTAETHNDVKDIKKLLKPLSFTYRAPFQVPLLTENAVEFPEIKKEIKNCLLNRDNQSGILAITAIQGLGGIGKTTLAIIIANDQEVQKCYSDGILWVTLGQEPDKLSLLYSWIEALGDYQVNTTSLEAASKHLRTLLHKKRILLVIDDAWNVNDIKPFLVGGSNCQTIVTTRKNYIADDLGANSYPLNVMTEHQSLELFKIVLKNRWDENEKEDALKVANAVGRLPLALNLAAKKKKRGYSWVDLHKALKEEIAYLVLESPRRSFRKEENFEDFLSLEACLNKSLRDLKSYNEKVFENFIWLGVLPEDVKINERMASTLWDTNEEDAGKILEFLWEEGLLLEQYSTIQFGDETLKTYSLHDFLHDFTRHYLTLSTDTKKVTDIPGLGLKLNDAHSLLLTRYQSKMENKFLWHTLKDDAYIHSHLAWHLEKAEDIEAIHALLSEENEKGENGWYKALESLGKNAVFIEDVMRAWNLSEKESAHQIKQGSKASSIQLEIRYALIYTSINSLSANVPVELLNTFLETKKWTETKVFIYAQKEPDAYIRAIKLISVCQKTKNESIKEDALKNAFDAVSKIKDNNSKAQALSSIVPNLDGSKKEELTKKYLNIAFNIKDDFSKVQALLSIVPSLDGAKKDELIKQALYIASKIQDDSKKSQTISSIVANLHGQKKEQVAKKSLHIASKIQDDYSKVQALLSIAPNFDGQKKEQLTKKSLYIASKIQDDCLRIQALSSIVPNLDEEIKNETIEKALDAISNIKHDYSRAQALSSIVHNLDENIIEEFIEKVLYVSSTIQNDFKRMQAISSVIPNLDENIKEEMIKKAVDFSFQIRNDFKRAQALSSIVPNLDGELKDETVDKVLDAISNVKDDSKRAQALSSIVPNLDGEFKEEVMEKALAVASKIQDDSIRAQALTSVVVYLDGEFKEEVMEKALAAASKIQDDYSRAQALSSIVSNLDGGVKDEIIRKTLDIATKIQQDYKRAQVLSFIVPNIDGQNKDEMMEKALDIVASIQYDSIRAQALSSIVYNFDGQNKDDVTKKALDIAFNIKDHSARTQAFVALVTFFDGRKKDEVIEKALDAASNIIDDSKRVQALLSIVPNLDGQNKNEMMEKALDITAKIQRDSKKTQALSSIVPNLAGQNKDELMKKALDVAASIQYDSKKAQVLSSIICNFDGQNKDKVIEKALNIAVNIKEYSARTQIFLTIIPNLDGELKQEVIKKALDVASNIKDDSARAQALLDVVNILDGQLKQETTENILHAASCIQYDSARVQVLSSIVPYLDGELKQEVMKKAFDAASNIMDNSKRVQALLFIAPNLNEKFKEEVMKKAFDAASYIMEDSKRVQALLSIVPNLDGELKQEVIEKAFDAASKINKDSKRAQALQSILPYLRNLPMNNSYFCWRKAIKDFRERTRSSLYIDISILTPIISDLGNGDTLLELLQTIEDVSRWWP